MARPQSLNPPVSTPRVPPFDAQQDVIRLYPLSNYTIKTCEAQPEEDGSVNERLRRLERYYEQHGMRRLCEGVLVFHEHGFPHIFLLQIKNVFFKLPGGHLPHDVDEVEGLKSRLDEQLAPTSHAPIISGWDVGHALAQWYRPNFEASMYPYLPPHVTRPKECRKLYLVPLPKARVLYVPKNMKLLAVPLFELYDNGQRYGPHLCAIPHYLSRYRREIVDEERGNVFSPTLVGPVDGTARTEILVGGESAENARAEAVGEVQRTVPSRDSKHDSQAESTRPADRRQRGRSRRIDSRRRSAADS